MLNYAPGPLDSTPMIDELLADQRTDPVVRTMFEDLKRNGFQHCVPPTCFHPGALFAQQKHFKTGDR